MRDQFDSNSLFPHTMKEAFEEFVNKDVGKHTNAATSPSTLTNIYIIFSVWREIRTSRNEKVHTEV